MNNLVYAMAGGQPAASGSSTLMSFMPIILIFFIIYFLMIRPQQKKQREHQSMLGQLKKGDRVMTSSGIYGSVVGIKDDVVVLKIADNVKVEFSKGAVSRTIPKEKAGD
ncbi:preprotein translocase subunit YajC [candidate division KSB1 bacterium]